MRVKRNKMKCPNCFKEMSYKRETRYVPDLSGTADYDYEYLWEQHKCKQCEITCEKDIYSDIDGEWHIPDEYKPTEKQVKTILFINGRLQLNLQALTKKQCWQDINKYFAEAKSTQLYNDENWYEIQDVTGLTCEECY